jgi:hypothetical protein
MDFPDRDVALAWVGRTLVDRDGVEIGACTAVFADDATQLPEWVCSELGGAAVFIPAVGAAESSGQVQVAVSRADVAEAPSVGDAQHISAEEEAALYRHYGIPHSRDASPTLLPTGDVEPPAQSVASDAAAPEVVATPAAVEPVAAPAVAAEPVAAPAVAEDAVPRTQPTSDAGQGPPGESAPPAGGRRRIGPAVAGLAAVGLALGVALRARRLRRRRPPTRTERLIERGRAASVALSARTGQIAASAAPLLETTKQVVRRRARAGAVAGAVPAAAALAVAAVRRRGSRHEPHN